MSSDDHGAHPEREIEEDVLAVPLIAWLGIVGTILIVASVFALTGMYYQTKHELTAKRYAAAVELVTPAEAKVAADKAVVDGYFRVPGPDAAAAQGPDAKQYVSIPVARGKAAVIEQYGN